MKVLAVIGGVFLTLGSYEAVHQIVAQSVCLRLKDTIFQSATPTHIKCGYRILKGVSVMSEQDGRPNTDDVVKLDLNVFQRFFALPIDVAVGNEQIYDRAYHINESERGVISVIPLHPADT